MNQNASFTKFLRQNALTLTVQVCSLLMLCLGTYVTTRLAPLAQDIAVVKSQVKAIESINKDQASKSDVEQILHRLDLINERVDKLIERGIK